MNVPIVTSVKRVGRVAVAGGIMGSLVSVFSFLQATPLGIFIIPVGTAVINGVGKFIREEWKINLPF